MLSKTIVSSAISLIIFSSVSTSVAIAAPNKVSVDGGQINFVGSVVAAPCVVDNDTSSQTVNLGQVSAKALSQKGSKGASVPFNINLVGCDLSVADNGNPEEAASYTKASIVFKGLSTSDDNTLALLANGSGDTVAQGVGIQIFQNDNMPVNINGTTEAGSTELQNGKNVIPFSASYVATGPNVIAGNANAVVSFRINYE